MLQKLMDDPIGRIAVSILLGFGLATLFRKVCNGKSCVIVQGPSISDVKKFYYKIDEDCYKYTPYATQCNAQASE